MCSSLKLISVASHFNLIVFFSCYELILIWDKAAFHRSVILSFLVMSHLKCRSTIIVSRWSLTIKVDPHLRWLTIEYFKITKR